MFNLGSALKKKPKGPRDIVHSVQDPREKTLTPGKNFPLPINFLLAQNFFVGRNKFDVWKKLSPAY
jgi:hypothetical protein